MRRYVRFGVLLGLCGLLSCNDSDTSSSPAPSCLLPGIYGYVKMTTLKLPYDPTCGANFTHTIGETPYRADNGQASLIEDGGGFLLQAGIEGRWKMKISCLDQNSAQVKVILSNKCSTHYETEATTTAQTLIQEGISSLFIAPYFIEWTCDGAVSCVVTEQWELRQSRQ